jgi:hypothetical protein
VDVGLREFSIVYKNKITFDGEEVQGCFKSDSMVIEISTSENKTEEQIKSTIFHETLHGILSITGQSATIEKENIEEGIVVTLELHLADKINWKHKMWKNWRAVDVGVPPED